MLTWNGFPVKNLNNEIFQSEVHMIQNPWELWTFPKGRSLEEAVLCTVAYADIFQYPLTLEELNRYLIGVAASLQQVALSVKNLEEIVEHNGYYVLRGKETLVSLRKRREQIAEKMWPAALAYGKAIARLPYVRMVAMTGALAMKNVELGDDFDYLVATVPGRVWTARRILIQRVVKPAKRLKHEVCPNYILSENSLALSVHDLFQAHELVQLIPLYGLPVYQQMRVINRWTEEFLPNAAGPPPGTPAFPILNEPGRKVQEKILDLAAGPWFEKQEMSRLQRKLNAQNLGEAQFLPDCCKGHLNARGPGIFTAFEERLKQINRI
jgi:hypothetical protein